MNDLLRCHENVIRDGGLHHIGALCHVGVDPGTLQRRNRKCRVGKAEQVNRDDLIHKENRTGISRIRKGLPDQFSGSAGKRGKRGKMHVERKSRERVDRRSGNTKGNLFERNSRYEKEETQAFPNVCVIQNKQTKRTRPNPQPGRSALGSAREEPRVT